MPTSFPSAKPRFSSERTSSSSGNPSGTAAAVPSLEPLSTTITSSGACSTVRSDARHPSVSSRPFHVSTTIATREPPLPGEPTLLERGGRLIDEVARLLLGEPHDELARAVLEPDPRRVPELGSRERDVREAVADVAGAVLATHLRLDVDAEPAPERLGHVE